jgi:hypothetical protein
MPDDIKLLVLMLVIGAAYIYAAWFGWWLAGHPYD